ncbi:MAG: FkbM family methyltransferase [Chloroflexota bacterium]|nr:FkbM family methyltransferase [Chloroflexota bacterium]
MSRVVRIVCYHVARSVVAWRPANAERVAVVAGGARVWVTLADYWFHGHLYFDGIHIHQPHVAPLLQRLLRPGDVVLDVGAHLGYYACLAASRGARVHAFEPHPELASRLHRSRDLNGFGERLRVVQQAVADTDGPGVLFMDLKAADEAGDSAGSGASILPLPRFGTRTALDTTFLRLDTYCRRRDVGSIRLLLIDAQGAEPRVLADAQRLLAEVRPAAVICVVSGLPGASSPSEVLGLLRTAGYVPYEIVAGGLVPFNSEDTVDPTTPWRIRDVCFLRAEDRDTPLALAAPTAAPLRAPVR